MFSDCLVVTECCLTCVYVYVEVNVAFRNNRSSVNNALNLYIWAEIIISDWNEKILLPPLYMSLTIKLKVNISL